MPKLQKPQEEKSIDILKRIAKRVEESTIDIHSIKSDLKRVFIRLTKVEHNTEITKVDVENLKLDMKEVKKDIKEVNREINDLIQTNTEVLAKMVTQKELQFLSQRVDAIENQSV